MNQAKMNQIPVAFVNLFTRRRLAEAVPSALPAAGDDVYLGGLGYEVAHREWTLLSGETVEIVVVVQPQVDATGQRPFNYKE